MKKTLATAILMLAGIAAAPVSAQSVTGNVTINGTVGGRCSVVQQGGGSEVASFAGTINLQRLDAADGTLRSSLASSSALSPADGLNVGTRVVCTSANPTIGVIATRLNTGGTTDPGAGYSNDINYTAQLKVNTASGGTKAVTYATSGGGAATTTQLGERIAAGNANNVDVSVYSLAAEGGSASLLAEGSYTGIITVTINPTT